MTETTFRPITDGEWLRMPWHAQQRWLLTANALRRQLAAELDAALAGERVRAAIRKSHAEEAPEVEKAQAILDALPADPDGDRHMLDLGKDIGTHCRKPECVVYVHAGGQCRRHRSTEKASGAA